MSANPVGWFEIYVQDMNRAKRFYESVFEVKLEKLNTPPTLNSPSMELWSFPSSMDQPGCSGALVKMEGARSGAVGTIVYFASEDCAVQEKRVLDSGGAIQRSKTAIGEYGFITVAVDTEGNVFGIHSLK
jgi:predicted enzyme related to lactoylglutathione lyase